MNKDDLATLGIGFGIGALTGAIIALLYAPQSGTETRGFIKDKAQVVKDKVTSKFKKEE